MHLHHELPNARIATRSSVTVGVFDGVHRGHQSLIDHAINRAAEVDGESIVVSFREHPDLLLRGEAPPPLMTIPDRLTALDRLGVDHVVLVRFTPELRDMSAETFAKQVLLEQFGCLHLVLGFDSAICKGREGTVERFQELGRELGFSSERAAKVERDGIPVSSSAIRAALAAGDVELAARLLGRPFTVSGTVIEGDRRGTDLGFPTANLAPPPLCLPAHGVYAAMVRHSGERHPAVANLGIRPTFDEDSPVLEVHLLDFEGDLYGEVLDIAFRSRIRDERKFDSIDELVAQIAADVETARGRLRRP